MISEDSKKIGNKNSKAGKPKGKEQRARMTKEQREYYILYIYRHILRRIGTNEIWEKIQEDGFEYHERTFHNLVAEARSRLVDQAEIVMETELDKAIKHLEELFFSALDGGDLKTALAVRREWSETLGLKQDKVVVVQDLSKKAIEEELGDLLPGLELKQLEELEQNVPNNISKKAKILPKDS